MVKVTHKFKSTLVFLNILDYNISSNLSLRSKELDGQSLLELNVHMHNKLGKKNYMCLRQLPCHIQPLHINNFYSISSIHIEKSSTHPELSV